MYDDDAAFVSKTVHLKTVIGTTTSEVVPTADIA